MVCHGIGDNPLTEAYSLSPRTDRQTMIKLSHDIHYVMFSDGIKQFVIAGNVTWGYSSDLYQLSHPQSKP